MIEKIKQFFKNISNKVSQHPKYKAFLRHRDKVAKWMLDAILAFLSKISPLLTFLCIKTIDPDLTSNEVS